MNKDDPGDPLVIVLRIGDPLLQERVAALLADVSGLRLARAGEAADLALVVPDALPAEPNLALTGRENEVLALLAEGASNKIIARRLGISVHTAKFHVSQLLDKLDATGRTDALAHAVRRGVLEL